MINRFICLCVVFCLAVVLQAQNNFKYRGEVDVEGGVAYNLNTAQTISTNNMQFYSSVTTSHGVQFKQFFIGLGAGYYHSYRDKENIYPVFGAFRYNWDNVKLRPFVGLRLGIAYDPYWISKVQKYGAVSLGFKLNKKFLLGCRGTVFSRPSRYFTANAALVLTYVF